MYRPKQTHSFHQTGSGLTTSRQTLLLPTDASPLTVASLLLQRLGPLYFRRLERISLGLIRVRTRADAVRFTLLGSPISLLTFAPARVDSDEVVYPIVGGWMAQSEGACGSLHLGTRPTAEGLLLWMEVRDYAPRLPSWLYRRTQAPLHHWIARDYLRHVAAVVRASPQA